MEAPGVAIGQEVEEEEEQAIQGSCALHFVRSSGLYLSRADFSVSLALFPCAWHSCGMLGKRHVVINEALSPPHPGGVSHRCKSKGSARARQHE